MTPLNTLRRSVRLYMLENDVPSFAALARGMRDDTHPTGWKPSTAHSVLSGDRPSRALMAALGKLRLEDGAPIPACSECGWATCASPNACGGNGAG